jgi:hypothetical protein
MAGGALLASFSPSQILQTPGARRNTLLKGIKGTDDVVLDAADDGFFSQKCLREKRC